MSNLIRKIMVYIDGTEPSITAAQYAIWLAAFAKAELIAQYVINSKAAEDLFQARIFHKDELVEYEQDMKADAERYLNYVRELARKKGVSIVARCSAGSIHQVIVDSVKENGVDLLVIGELARIHSRRDEFYGETERAMRSVPCSVLIVKDEERVRQLYESLV